MSRRTPPPQPPSDVLSRRIALRAGGVERRATIVHAPEFAIQPDLLIVFHGTRQTAQSMRAFSGYSFDDLATDGRFVVAYPDGFRRDWNGARDWEKSPARLAGIDDVAFTRDLITTLRTTLPVPLGNVYIVGFSLGGQMVIRLLHEIPADFAAAALISSTQPRADNFIVSAQAPPSSPASAVPVLIIHGTRDPLTPYRGGPVGFRGVNLRGINLSAEQTAAYYAQRNQITAPPTTTPTGSDTEDHTRTTRTEYLQAGRAPVTLITVHGGGHQVHNPAISPMPWFFGRSSRTFTAATATKVFFDTVRHTE